MARIASASCRPGVGSIPGSQAPNRAEHRPVRELSGSDLDCVAGASDLGTILGLIALAPTGSAYATVGALIRGTITVGANTVRRWSSS